MRGEAIDPLAVRCPQCGMPKWEQCVYVLPPTINLEFGTHYLSYSQQRAVARVGKPTQRPHAARTDNARRRYQLKKNKEDRSFEAASAQRRLIATIEREWERQEHFKLREWFRRHGRILIGDEQ